MKKNKCKSCGKKIPMGSNYCFNCGNKVENEEIILNSNNDFMKQKEINVSNSINKKMVIRLSILCVVVLACIFILEITVFSNMREYNKAIKYINNAQYEEAITVLGDLGDYRNSTELINQANQEISKINYSKAIDEIKENTLKSLIDAEVILSNLDSGYNDRDSLLVDCRIDIGNMYFENADFTNALEYYNQSRTIDETNEDVIKRINKINFYNNIQGEWLNATASEGIIVEDFNVSLVDFEKTNNDIKAISKIFKGSFKPVNLGNNKFAIELSGMGMVQISLEDDKLIISTMINEKRYMYSKRNFTDEIAKKPKIGMTEEEVLNSSWGKPNKINKDTYSWGTNEQWCYPDYKYVYFENGIVTSISE